MEGGGGDNDTQADISGERKQAYMVRCPGGSAKGGMGVGLGLKVRVMALQAGAAGNCQAGWKVLPLLSTPQQPTTGPVLSESSAPLPVAVAVAPVHVPSLPGAV